MSGEWWRTAFDEAWLLGSAPFLTPERTAREVEGLVRLLAPLAPPARVADIPCGFGRIARALAARGFRVAGLDISEPQLRAALRAPPPRPGYALGDMRLLPFAREAFDAVLTLDVSIGYGSEEDDLAALAGIRSTLRPGGLHVLEVYHREGVLRRFQPSSFYCREGVTVHVARTLDAERRRYIERRSWGDGRGRTGTMTSDIRLYDAGEVRSLLARAGLGVVRACGSFGLEEFTPNSPRLLALSRRGPGGG